MKTEMIVTRSELRADRLRKIGWLVLLSGLVIGGMIYLYGPLETSDDNSLMSQYYKNQETEAQRLWGAQGSMILGLTRSLKRASTYSIIVIILSVLVSLACFFLANRSSHHNQSTDCASR